MRMAIKCGLGHAMQLHLPVSWPEWLGHCLQEQLGQRPWQPVQADSTWSQCNKQNLPCTHSPLPDLNSAANASLRCVPVLEPPFKSVVSRKSAQKHGAAVSSNLCRCHTCKQPAAHWAHCPPGRHPAQQMVQPPQHLSRRFCCCSDSHDSSCARSSSSKPSSKSSIRCITLPPAPTPLLSRPRNRLNALAGM